MKRLFFKEEDLIRHRKDVAKIRKALNLIGYDADDFDIQNAYESLSADWSAGWLLLSAFKSDEEIALKLIESKYLEEDDRE